MSEQMKAKFEKYWTYVHGLMAVATVLDPRFKLHMLQVKTWFSYVNFSPCSYFLVSYVSIFMLQALFQTLYGYENAAKEVAKIRELILSLLVEYQQASEGEGMSNIQSTSTTGGDVDEVYDIFDEYMNSKPAVNTSQVRTELDLYLEEDPLPQTQELDIIGWWKFGGIKYPTLQMIAHDILPIPVTSVALECVFSASGRLISAHRSRLAPKTAEALMCMQAWSRADMLGNSYLQYHFVFQLLLCNMKSKFSLSFAITLGDIHGDLLAVQNVLEDEQEEMVSFL
jgi:hypothetical protein